MFQRNMVFSKTEQVQISWTKGKAPRLNKIDDFVPSRDAVVCPKMKLVDIGSLSTIRRANRYHFELMENHFGWSVNNIADQKVRKRVNLIVQSARKGF
jgi:hypothetical protein